MKSLRAAFSYIKNYLKQEKRGLFLAAVAIFAIVILFSFYLKKIGVPMTAARNSYNLAVQQYNAHKYALAKASVEQSLSYWDTPEAETLLKEITQQNPGL